MPCPDHVAIRDALLHLMTMANSVRVTSSQERDKLQKTIDRLWRNYQVHDQWTSVADFAHDAATLLAKSTRDLTQKHWGDTKEAKARAKEYAVNVDDFAAGPLTHWLERWWAHVYAPVVALLDAGGEWALRHRRRSGQLGFDDLLTETARLLRTHPAARQAVGERYRHLLVDEFQDTDPVQAEVCFLIASEPSQGREWDRVRLRDGALFVVGDPKQSIYRFRRADLAMYRLVESRIAGCGKVVHLTRNFRSVPAIGAVVNEHFVGVFASPGDRSPQSTWQAPFATFMASSDRVPHAQAGISRYQIGQAGRATHMELVAEDSALLASWIASRCAVGGDRTPADFLILTPGRKELAQYAHELALRNVPVAVTGAVSTVDDVLHELLVIVRALADPANPVAVIAALEGWCVGCSHEDLWNARSSGLEFRITHAPDESDSPAGAGLQQLYAWWITSQRVSAASLLERVMDDSGLLLLAASADLGDRSAGQLLHLVTLLRNSTRTDLAAAIDTIQQSLRDDDESPTLRVARGNAVRLMNLHKAKGLEAPVVILAAPTELDAKTIRIATWRTNFGTANGALRVVDDDHQPIAQPLEWEEIANQENVRVAAERARLLYVAVTRAEEELVVSQRASYAIKSGEARGDTSQWAPLAPVLLRHSRELQLTASAPPGRRSVRVSSQQVRDEIDAANARLRSAERSRYTLVSVTEAARRDPARASEDGMALAQEMDGTDDEISPVDTGAQSRGARHSGIDVRVFGTLAHAAMEAALRGRDDDQLLQFVRARAWHDLPTATLVQRAAIVARVMKAVAEARTSVSWALLQANGLAELNVASVSGDFNSGQGVLSEGILDAAALGDDGWTVVDWKFSGSSDALWQTQVMMYQAQAE
ncbi:MAG: UvrD-helicase domain-containing protein, partial [Gemmatimonadaceae bacterium]